jgi:hypothetical protein
MYRRVAWSMLCLLLLSSLCWAQTPRPLKDTSVAVAAVAYQAGVRAMNRGAWPEAVAWFGRAAVVQPQNSVYAKALAYALQLQREASPEAEAVTLG